MKEKILNLLTSDTIVPEQFFDTVRRTESLGPEKRLLLAVLQEAVDCYQKYKGAQDRFGRERFQEVDSWIKGEGNDWIFSFDNICDYLGIDPHYLRRGIQGGDGKSEDKVKTLRRSRPRRQAA